MKAFFIFLFLLFFIVEGSTQSHFRTYDLDENLRQIGTDVHVLDDGLLILGIGNCDGESCTILLKTDMLGDTIWVRRFTDFFGHTRRTVIQDSILYMPGEIYRVDGSSERDGFRLFRFDLNGNKIDSRKYDLSKLADPEVDSIRMYLAHGNVVYKDKIIVYGEVFEQDPANQVFSRGLMVWYNMDMSYDTMMLVQPRYEEFDIWDVEVGPDGLLTLLVDDDILVDGNEQHYRYFKKYDERGQEVFSSETVLLYNNSRIFLSLEVLSNGDMITYFDNDSIHVDSHVIISVSPDGTIKWLHQMDPNLGIDFRDILEVSESADGHILVSGNYYDYSNYRQGAYVAKLDRTNGDLLWERVYQDWTELAQSDTPAFSHIWRIKLLEDESLIMVGEYWKETPIDPFDNDILLIRTDENGCVQSGCGGFEQTVAGLQKYYPIFYEGDLWYHQDPEADGGIYKVAYGELNITEDDVYRMGQGTLRLSPEEIGGIAVTDNFFKLRNEGRQVYLREENRDILLYDFTLAMGDVFSSEYVQQDLEVIDSDTILLLNREKRRTWTLACMDNPEQTLTWIEGIGTDYGVLWPRDFCSGDYGDVRLTCYYRYERLHYINEDIGGCFLSSTHDPESTLLRDISLSPNPTQDYITLTAPADLHIERTEILDTQGRTHTQFHENTSEVRLDLSGYPSGLYFVSVHTREGSVVKKIVVSR